MHARADHPRHLAALAALALPATAGAKQITALDVCGTDGCTRIADRSVLHSFEEGSALAEAPPAGRHVSYALRVRVRDEAGVARTGWTSLWVPSAHVIAFANGQPGATFTPLRRRSSARCGAPPAATPRGRRDASLPRRPRRASPRSSRRPHPFPRGRPVAASPR